MQFATTSTTETDRKRGMWQKFKCRLGWHDWLGGHVLMTGNTRECRVCGPKERLTMVDIGRNRIWIKEV